MQYFGLTGIRANYERPKRHRPGVFWEPIFFVLDYRIRRLIARTLLAGIRDLSPSRDYSGRPAFMETHKEAVDFWNNIAPGLMELIGLGHIKMNWDFIKQFRKIDVNEWFKSRGL